ncbi:hypothetical protein ACFL3I_06105 [Pseudomonadota bacterium]
MKKHFKKNFCISILTLAISTPAALLAQEEEKAADSYIYATYFYCATSAQEQADELVKANSVPVYDAAVADGTIKSWGWLAHHTGGKWRRIQYHGSDSLAGLLAAQETIGERMDAAGGDKDNNFGKICSAHDDYIWKSVAGSASDSKRGAVSLSVYHVCEFAKEERGDEIVKNVFAPIYDKAVADGKISSWGWNSHVIGGEYRRLGTMTGANYPDLLKARSEIMETIYGDGDNAEANEFSGICTSHSDYLWDIQHEKS